MPLGDFSNVRLLVVGDVMLDRYWFGDASRISPEAPVPVVKIERGEDVDNVDRYDPKTLDIPIPDLKQLGEGVVPMPVALLNLEEEPDRGQGTGGSK